MGETTSFDGRWCATAAADGRWGGWTRGRRGVGGGCVGIGVVDGFLESVRDSEVRWIGMAVERDEVWSEVEEGLMNEGILEPA